MQSIRSQHMTPKETVRLAATVMLFCMCAGSARADSEQAADRTAQQAAVAPSNPTPYVLATTTQVVAKDLVYPPPCATKSVYTGLFVLNGGMWEDHNRCYSATSRNKDPSWRNQAMCMYKYPLGVDKPSHEIIFRVYNVDASCRYLRTYKDYHPAYNVLPDPAYQVRPSTTTIQNATSKSVVDRAGGTTYEYYSLRGTDAGLKAGTYENLIHAHFGAAMQTVLFSEVLTKTPCGTQGVWNPTQAGAACGTLEQRHIFVKAGTHGLNVLCDALLDNSCTRASSTVGHTAYRVLNWDYSRLNGDGKYVGPYNAGDTARLGQTLTYMSPYYSQYDAYWRHSGSDKNVIATVPTLYMSSHWRRFTHPDKNGFLVTKTIPENTTGDESNNFTTLDTRTQRCDLYDWKWVTMDNTYFSTKGKSITLAWFYGPEWDADKYWPYSDTCIQEHQIYRTINVWNVPHWRQRKNVAYRFRWVMFPYRYDEVIVYGGKSMTVRDAIAKMATDYRSNLPLQRYYDYSTNTHRTTTYTVPKNFTRLATLGYLLYGKVADSIALYTCQNGRSDTFLRTDAGLLRLSPGSSRRLSLYETGYRPDCALCLLRSEWPLRIHASRLRGLHAEGLLGYLRKTP